MVKSIDKGKEGERELAQIFRRHGYKARRGQQYEGSSDSPDVVGLPGIHVECKRVEHFRLEDSMEQARNDCGPFDLPAVFHRKNRKPWVVVMDIEDWFLIYEAYRGNLD